MSPLNQKLEMIKMNEEGMSKARSPASNISQAVDAKEKFLKKIKCFFNEHINKKTIQP